MSVRGAVAVFALASGLALADSDEALTTREMRAMSAREADQQIRADLLSMLQPASKITTGNLRRIHDLWLNTRPYATAFRGLCRRDTVSITYAPTNDGKAYEDVPIRPYALDMSHRYYFVIPPRREDAASDAGPAWRAPLNQQCAHAGKDEWSGWFTADDQRLAVRGGFVLEAAIAWAQMPGHELISCRVDDHGCARDLLRSVKLETLGAVATCEAAADQSCYAVEAGSFAMTIRARKVEIVTAADIISIDGGYQIVVT